MENTSRKFLFDPKWLSIIALVVSIIALCWTCSNQIEQNRRWDIHILGKLTLSKASCIVWKEITARELKETEWGYKLKPIAKFGEGFSEVKYQLLYALRFADDSYMPLEGSNPFFCVDEAKLETARFKKSHPEIEIPKNGFPLIKHYMLNFCFEVDGSTRVIDVEASAYMEYPHNKESIELLKSRSPFVVSPGRSKNFLVEVFFPHDTELPHKTIFHVVAHYTDSHSQRKVLYVDLEYYRERNRWGYLSEETKLVSNHSVEASP